MCATRGAGEFDQSEGDVVFCSVFPIIFNAFGQPVDARGNDVRVTLISLLYQLGLVLSGDWSRYHLKGIPSAQLWAKRLAGVALIGFAAKSWRFGSNQVKVKVPEPRNE